MLKEKEGGQISRAIALNKPEVSYCFGSISFKLFFRNCVENQKYLGTFVPILNVFPCISSFLSCSHNESETTEDCPQCCNKNQRADWSLNRTEIVHVNL